MNKKLIISELENLRDLYFNEVETSSDNLSEETIRSGYLNKVLDLFGWNLSTTMEVIQEKKLTGSTIMNRLKSIGSTHTKPDYRMLDRGILRMYLDAKIAPEDFRYSPDISFQIRSYGWSSQLDISMVTNFEHFKVYDTTFKPEEKMDSNYRAFSFTIDDLINEFDIYSQFLDREKVQNSSWDLTPFGIELHRADSKTLDDAFIELIGSFQLELANGLLTHNPRITESQLQYYTQIIINRMIFIRTLEDINLEPIGKLKEWLDNGKGFWNQFHKSSKNEFYLKYDGALFEEQLPSHIKINDDSFNEFIEELYGPTPYKFDVIEPEMIAEIYDLFLGKQLVIENKGTVSVENKKISPTGSVPTPSELASYLTNIVLELDEIDSISKIMDLKIIDPCAGSGSFLITAFDSILNRLHEIKGESELPYELIKSIVKNCLYGVDIDPVAIEVLKMTISLKLIMSNHKPVEPIENMLSDFEGNFQLGNSIVSTDIFDYSNIKLSQTEKIEQNPTDYSEIFPEIISQGGFTHVLTNPPYVEPKHFRKNWPETHKYFKETYISNSGKSDISLFFLEKVFDIVRTHGKVGIIIQKRFFNAGYGKNIRKWLAEKGYLSYVKEYNANNIFKSKITYIALLVGEKTKNEDIDYEISLDQVNSKRTNLIEIIEKKDDNLKFSNKELLTAPQWSYRYFKSALIINSLLANDFFTINGSKRFKVTVGPQVLDKSFYVLYAATFEDDNIVGKNKKGDKVCIEKELVKPLYENEKMNSFTNFEVEEISKYIIFPYDDEGNLIPIDKIKSEYPLSFKYFDYVKEESTNAFRKNPDEFYGYTRVQNINLIKNPKVFIPMTGKRVIASLSKSNIFGDNSNINAIVDKKNDITTLKAITVIMNSKIFNLLTIPLTGDASGGYYKMNKQFIGEVPIPILSLTEIRYLSTIYDKIEENIKLYYTVYGDRTNLVLRELQELQSEQNNFMLEKYNLSTEEISILQQDVDVRSLDWLKNTIWR